MIVSVLNRCVFQFSIPETDKGIVHVYAFGGKNKEDNQMLETGKILRRLTE